MLLPYFLETKKTTTKQTAKPNFWPQGWQDFSENPPPCICHHGMFEASPKAQEPQRLVWNNAGHPYCLRGWFRKSGEIIPKSFLKPFLPCPHGWKWKKNVYLQYDRFLSFRVLFHFHEVGAGWDLRPKKGEPKISVFPQSPFCFPGIVQ